MVGLWVLATLRNLLEVSIQEGSIFSGKSLKVNIRENGK